MADIRYGSNSSTAFPTVFAYEAITIWKLVAVGDIKLIAQVTHGAKGWLRSVGQGCLLAESISRAACNTAAYGLSSASEQDCRWT